MSEISLPSPKDPQRDLATSSVAQPIISVRELRVESHRGP